MQLKVKLVSREDVIVDGAEDESVEDVRDDLLHHRGRFPGDWIEVTGRIAPNRTPLGFPAMTRDQMRPATYVRLYADSAGESHFEDVYLPGEEHSSPTGGVEDLRAPLGTQGVVFRRVLSEASDTTPHNARKRLLIIQLNGTVEAEVSDGEVRRFGPGSALLVEDTTGKGHLTRNVYNGVRTTLIAELTE